MAAAVASSAGEEGGGGVDWELVATHATNDKTPKQCQKRWLKVLKFRTESSRPIRVAPWDADEDKTLMAAVQACSPLPDVPPAGVAISFSASGTDEELVPRTAVSRIDWDRISAEYMQGQRTAHQCAQRYEGMERYRLRIETDPNTGQIEDGTSLVGLDSSCMKLLESPSEPNVSVGARVGAWLPHEDEQLLEAVELFNGRGRGGAVDWGRVVEYLGGRRTCDQCRVRWTGVLQVCCY